MLRALLARVHQKHRTIGFPDAPPMLPDRLRGRPEVNSAKCRAGCRLCAEACPTDAIDADKGSVRFDLGRCLFCPECERACPQDAIHFTTEYRLAASRREDLVFDGTILELARAMDKKSRKLFGRSLKLREVSAGGCNGCEADVNVLNTVVFDLGRFGIQFVASPRHADGLLVTGPVTRNMESALRETYEAVPSPKLVIAVGACAISGGPYAGHAEQRNGAGDIVPVDLHIPGCPPHPITILDGLLRWMGRITDPSAQPPLAGAGRRGATDMNELMKNLAKLQALEFGEVKEKNADAIKAELRGRVPAQILGHYERLVARGKKGVAAVRNQVCTACHMRVPMAVVNTLMRGDDIQLCGSCGRYLYLEAVEEAAAPEKPAIPAKPAAKKARKRKAAACKA